LMEEWSDKVNEARRTVRVLKILPKQIGLKLVRP